MIVSSIAYTDMDDKTLVQQAQSGVKLAFSELVRRQQRALTRFLLKMTRDLEFTEDVVQDTFIKAYTKLDTFRGQSSFKSWLFKIGLNTAKNKLRSQRSGHTNIDNVHLSENSTVENSIYHSNIKSQILRAIEHLPEKQKEAIYLRIYEDLSFKEIADLMESPYDTAKANYRHGLMKLRTSVKRDETFEDWQDLSDSKAVFKKVDL